MAEDDSFTSRGGSPQPRAGAQRLQLFLEVLCILLAAVVGWLYALAMPWTASILLLLAVPVLLGRVCSVRTRVRVLLAAAIVLAAVLGWRSSIREFESSLERLRELKGAAGPAGFRGSDRLAVYGLNLAMGLGGYVAGFPEVSKETLLLCVRDGAVRTWRSDFAMRSPRVRREVRRFSELAQAGGASAPTARLPTTRITWTRYDPGC
jgi:hypothetical protein